MIFGLLIRYLCPLTFSLTSLTRTWRRTLLLLFLVVMAMYSCRCS